MRSDSDSCAVLLILTAGRQRNSPRITELRHPARSSNRARSHKKKPVNPQINRIRFSRCDHITHAAVYYSAASRPARPAAQPVAERWAGRSCGGRFATGSTAVARAAGRTPIWIPGLAPGVGVGRLLRGARVRVRTHHRRHRTELRDRPPDGRHRGSLRRRDLPGRQTRLAWPVGHDLRRIPVREPTPAYPHSLVRRSDNPHPGWPRFGASGSCGDDRRAGAWTPGAEGGCRVTDSL